MAVKFQNGAAVVQVQSAPITGTVVRFAFSETDGSIQYIVGWTDAAGQAHERASTEDQIAEAPAA